MEMYYDTVTDTSGNIINGATVTVYYATGGVATIYDKDGSPQANPFLSGLNRSEGEVEFAAADGMYDIKIVNGAETDWKTDVSLLDTNTFTALGQTATVKLVRGDSTAVDVDWIGYKETGEIINTTSSTTDGFYETHLYAQTNGFNLFVDGGGITPSNLNGNVIAFLSSSRQTLGPCDSSVYEIMGVIFNFAGQGITSGTAVTVDSFAKGKIWFDGQIVCQHAGTALEFAPSTYFTGDAGNNQGVQDFFFRVVQNDTTAAGARCIVFNGTNGYSLHGANYSFEEVNGGEIGALWTTGGGGIITGCRFKLHGVHGFANGTSGIGIDVLGDNITGCDFDIEISTPVSAQYTARINSKSSNYKITDLTSGQVKICLHTAAAANKIDIYAPNASGLTITDNAGGVASNVITYNGSTYGTRTNDNAATGVIGELVESDIAAGSGVALTTGVSADVTSISLTAGDWDIGGYIGYTPAGTTSFTKLAGSSSLVSATLSANGPSLYVPATVPGANNMRLPLPMTRVTIAATTTVYLVALANFTVSTMEASGRITARRVR